MTLGLDPGVREAWHRGRARYAVWLLRVREPAVWARAAEVAAAIGPTLRPQPASEMHITLFVCGFPTESPRFDDDVGWDTLRAQRESLLAFSAAPPRLAIGAANAFLSCPFLEVLDPAGDLARLRQALAPHAPEIRFAPYLPHITVGLLPEAVPTSMVIQRLQPFRPLPEITLRPSAIELVEFDAARAGAPLMTRWSLPFREAAA